MRKGRLGQVGLGLPTSFILRRKQRSGMGGGANPPSLHPVLHLSGLQLQTFSFLTSLHFPQPTPLFPETSPFHTCSISTLPSPSCLISQNEEEEEEEEGGREGGRKEEQLIRFYCWMLPQEEISSQSRHARSDVDTLYNCISKLHIATC